MPLVTSRGFTSLVRSLYELELPSSIAPTAKLSISIGGRRLLLEASRSLELSVRAELGEEAEAIIAADGSFLSFEISRGMEQVPLYPGAIARSVTAMGIPFMVWLLEESGNPLRAARCHALPERELAYHFSIHAKSEESLHELLRALRSLKDLGLEAAKP